MRFNKSNLLVLIAVLIGSIQFVFSQQVLDTIDTENGPMVIYSNRTWEYIKDIDFDGILNHELHEMVTSDSSLNFFQSWDNEVCYTSGRGNNMSLLKDTLWLCTLDDKYGAFHPPVPGIVTSRYGYRNGRHHSGIDLDLNTGDTVRACWDGKIRYSKYNGGGFGNLIIVRHYNGLETFYAHLSKLIAVPNQDVKAGDVIGLGGNTGRSYGAHLHFEVRFYDASINPEEVIDFGKHACKDENLFVHKGLFRPGAKPSDLEDHGESQAQTLQAVQTVQRKYYKVRSGDTLTEIANRNKTTVSKICQLNGIRPTSVIQIGKSLRIR